MKFRTLAPALPAALLLPLLATHHADAVPRRSGTEILKVSSPLAKLPAGFTIKHPKDGAEMVWVPAGFFEMGVDADTSQKQAEQLGYKDYHQMAGQESFPAHKVFVDGFFMDKYEVTYARWKQFVDAAKFKQTGTIAPTWVGPDLKPEEANLPIAQVTWKSAQIFANWAGKQLPTEAMWEKAARGTDGRWYPWGNEKPSRDYGVIAVTDQGLRGTEPVGGYPKGASPYGCMDMAGNVYEWTNEWKEPYPNNPEPDAEWGQKFVALRGGSFYHGRHSYRCDKRMGFEQDETYYHVGFRTAWYPPANFDAHKYALR